MADTSDNTHNHPGDTQMEEDSLDMEVELDPDGRVDVQSNPSIDDSEELEDDYDELVKAQERAESETHR
jgi:hypothetical protein